MDIAEIKRLVEEGKIEYVKIGASDIEGSIVASAWQQNTS